MAAKKAGVATPQKKTVKLEPKQAPSTRQITIDVPSTTDLREYTLGNGRTILVFEAVKRQGKPSKACCAYCERGFHQAPPKPLDAARLSKLAARKSKRIAAAAEDIQAAIKLCKRTDQQAKRAIKSDEEYLLEILQNAHLPKLQAG